MKKKLLFAIFSVMSLTGFSQCAELFISEYVEGSSFNKALEIYNPTSGPVNLSTYKLVLKGFNASGVPFSNSPFVFPNEVLAPGDVYIISNTAANAAILAVADTTNDDICNYNGDDAVVFLHGTDTIDIIGQVGVDPGTNWPVGTGATSEFTLVRKPTVQEGTLNWTIGATQWNVFPQNTTSNLNSHTMNPCAAPTDTLVEFTATAGSTTEGSVKVVNLSITLPVASAQSVNVVLKTGDPADVNGFSSQTVNFAPSATTGTVSITITDDPTDEPAEVLTFALRSPSALLEIGPDSIYTLTIAASDGVFNPGLPFYTIAQVRGTNAQGQADSNGVVCGVGGKVYGINTRTTGFSFTINDGTAGMGVFSNLNTFGYTVNEGDSVVVYGEVTTFRGLAQMSFIDTLLLINSGNPIPAPVTVSALDETTEGELIRINNLTLVNPSQWTNNTAGFTVDATNGASTFQVRIERNTTAIPMPAPTGAFDVIGIGSQFATVTSAPYTDGYQIVPRKVEDVFASTGIENEMGWNINVYPNPSSGQLNITSELNDYSLQIIDLTGKTVMTRTHLSANTQLDMSGFTNGIYLVKITDGVNQLTKRVILKK